jgi:transposase-like protein
MAKDLDTQVEAFRHRRLDQGPYTFVAADALVLKVREGGRVARVHALIATGVNADGYREVLGINVTTAEPSPRNRWPTVPPTTSRDRPSLTLDRLGGTDQTS